MHLRSTAADVRRLELPTAAMPACAAVAARPPADPISLAGLGACVAEARASAAAGGDGPPDPRTFTSLRARVAKAAAALPAAARSAVATPLLATLDRLGPAGYARVLAGDPSREGEARLLLDVAQAVLQPAEGYQAPATVAFQAVVGDLYDGFLSAERGHGVKPPDHGVAPPLVRWGSAEAGPYTWPATATASLGVKAAVVSLPAASAEAGLLAWPALAHETAGHDVLSADDGLRDELARDVKASLLAAGTTPPLASYWADRIDETAADVMGVLNMGPAAAVGLIGYFRALNGAWAGRTALRNVGRAEDPHPADIVRAYLGAEVVRRLPFHGAAAWADRLTAEADRDLGQIRLGDLPVTAAAAKASAATVAEAIVGSRLKALEGHALGELQTWRDEDEALVARLRPALGPGGGARTAGLPSAAEGACAAHAVAAAVYEAVGGGAGPPAVMPRMIALLGRLHQEYFTTDRASRTAPPQAPRPVRDTDAPFAA